MYKVFTSTALYESFVKAEITARTLARTVEQMTIDHERPGDMPMPLENARDQLSAWELVTTTTLGETLVRSLVIVGQELAGPNWKSMPAARNVLLSARYQLEHELVALLDRMPEEMIVATNPVRTE